MKRFGIGFCVLTLVALSAFSAFGQETEERVVDEVVAQVNEGVITLSRIKREIKSAVDTKVQEGTLRPEAERIVKEKQGELIANMINEELLLQRAKEMKLDSDVEASINQRFLQIMKQNNLKTLDALFQEMQKTGVDPQEIRELWRKQETRNEVLRREVQMKVYWGFNGKQLKDYFEKNKVRFTKPETVTISEIFLSFAGREEAAVREKAKQLVAQIRAGADFIKIVTENSDREKAAETKGKVETFNLKDLDEKFANALKGLKVGDVTDPIEIDQVGINILRVDERTQASAESFFDENAVRMAMLQDVIVEEQKKFLASLRENSYIKINDSYRPLVAPILFAQERKDKTEKPENK